MSQKGAQNGGGPGVKPRTGAAGRAGPPPVSSRPKEVYVVIPFGHLSAPFGHLLAPFATIWPPFGHLLGTFGSIWLQNLTFRP